MNIRIVIWWWCGADPKISLMQCWMSRDVVTMNIGKDIIIEGKMEHLKTRAYFIEDSLCFNWSWSIPGLSNSSCTYVLMINLIILFGEFKGGNGMSEVERESSLFLLHFYISLYIHFMFVNYTFYYYIDTCTCEWHVIKSTN